MISEKVFRDHEDNAWATLEFNAQPPGVYYLEMCCPLGSIGWWSLNDDLIDGGQAYVNGVRMQRDSRSLLERMRSAMDFQLDVLRGREGLIVIEDEFSNGTHNGYPTDYWDNFPFGYMSAYANIYFYASLAEMAELEEAIGEGRRAEELRDLMPLLPGSSTKPSGTRRRGGTSAASMWRARGTTTGSPT